MEELVYLKKDQALTDSLIVAEMFGKRHDNVMRSIEKLIGGLPKNKDTHLFEKTWYKHPQNGERYPKYLMNRDGFSLLVMGFTGKKALEWKLKYIEAFNKMEKLLSEKQTSIWLETRKQGMLVRKEETGIIQKLVEYAKEQGSNHADMLYMTYSKLANKMVGITSRDLATNAQLNDLSTMERLIAKVVFDGMEQGKHYKEIYKESKERLETVKGWLHEVA
ncbi:MAG: Rha family transcriptional regulator [Clostridia bacterium]|nr:Rha family transcriptional regulator [Clostridia bacterium]